MAKQIETTQHERIDKGLLKIASNILTPLDVRTKANYWKSEVIIYTGWMFTDGAFNKKGWPRDFSFMPHVDDYKEIKKEIIEDLQKAKITPCYVLSSENNVISFAFQPKSREDARIIGIDFLRPDVVLFFKGGKSNTWKEHAVMYRIVSVDYIDTRRLVLEIVAKKDYAWLYHLNVLSSPAVVRVSKSQLNRYKEVDKADETKELREYPDICFSYCGHLTRVKYLSSVEKGTGIARVNPGKPTRDEWQPRIQLYVSDADMISKSLDVNQDSEVVGGTGQGDDEGDFTGNYRDPTQVSRKKEYLGITPEGCHLIMKDERGNVIGGCMADIDNVQCNGDCPKFPLVLSLRPAEKDDFMKTLGTPTDIHFFVFPAEMKVVKTKDGQNLWPLYHMDKTGKFPYKGKGEKASTRCATNYANAYNSWLPEPFNEQPHLIASEHSSVQFFFMRKLINSATLSQCRITWVKRDGNFGSEGDGEFEELTGCQVRGKIKGQPYGTVKHVLQYKVYTKASLGGICYHFETGSQWFRAELGLTGFVSGKDFFQILMNQFRSRMDTWAKKKMGGAGKGGATKMMRALLQGVIMAVPGWIAEKMKNMKTIPQDFLKEQGLNLKTKPPTDVPATQGGAEAMDKGGESKTKSGGDGGDKKPSADVGSWGEGTKRLGLNTGKQKTGAMAKWLGKRAVVNAWDGLGNTLKRSTSFANTINMDYDFGEFYNRSQADPFEIRYEISNQLYDNLYNNNNSAVAQEIDCRIACVNNLLNPLLGAQEIQADIDIIYDGVIGSEYEAAFSKGQTYWSRKTFETDFPPLTLQHAEIPSVALDLRSADPGMEGGVVNIKGGANKRGNPVGGKDHTATKRTAVYVNMTSYITNQATGDMGAGQQLMASLIDQLPSSWFKNPKSGSPPNGTWYFHGGEPHGEVKFQIPEANYKYRIFGFNTADEQQSKGMANEAIFWFEGGNKDDESSEWGKLCMRLDGQEEQKVETTTTDIPPPDVIGDNSLPPTHTEGGFGNPMGGGGLSEDVEDIDEFSAEEEFFQDLGRDDEIPLDESLEKEGEDEDEGSEDIYEEGEEEGEDEDEEEEEEEEDETNEDEDNLANENINENEDELDD